jgi:hypothetical protein
MIKGSCLCGGVTFEFERMTGPFELCHCSRCRKVSGSAFMAGVAAPRAAFKFLTGHELVKRYDAPILKSPPAYRSCFCSRCGCPVPDPLGKGDVMEIAAGLLDDDPGVRPDKHIFTDKKSPWYTIADTLPQYDEAALLRHRSRT